MPLTFRHVGTVLVGLFAAATAVNADQSLPGPADLQRLQDVLRQQPLPTIPPEVVPVLPGISPTANQLREDTRFRLETVELRGVTLIEPAKLLPYFEALTGQQTSLAALDRVVAEITALYRNQGHFLSRAYLPPQEIQNGHVIIQVVEGQLDGVHLQASSRIQENPLVHRILSRLENGTPVTSERLENILLLLNDLPGLSASGTLAPGEDPGTASLTIHMEETRGNVEMGFSNWGTRYIGPNRFEAGVTVNNILAPGGDSLQLDAIQTPNFSDLTFFNATYGLPLNAYGTSFETSVYRGISRPKWTLSSLDINSHTSGFSLTLNQNMARQRALSWDIYGTFDWNDANSTSLGSTLSTDHLRVARLGSQLAAVDGFGGFTTGRMELSRGLDVFNSTQNGSLGGSRLRGHASGFHKANLDIWRLQRLNSSINILTAASGQFSTHALLAGEEFGLGGEGFGRGYDTNELVGEQGLATRTELQMNFYPDWPWLDTWQLFGFYDYGMVWNKDRDPTESNQAKTLSSIGVGARMQFNDTVSGEVVLANPMTRPVLTNGDKNPTIFFRLKSKVNFETLGSLHKGGNGS